MPATLLDKKAINYQQEFLEQMVMHKVIVNIYLTNGIKLNGIIKKFDENIIILMDEKIKNHFPQLVYRHAISSIFPVETKRT